MPQPQPLKGRWAPVTRDAVIAAITEFDTIGRAAFLARYGFAPAARFLLTYGGGEYDSKALLGAAYGHATGTPLAANEFSGGTAGAAGVLRRLGFDVTG